VKRMGSTCKCGRIRSSSTRNGRRDRAALDRVRKRDASDSVLAEAGTVQSTRTRRTAFAGLWLRCRLLSPGFNVLNHPNRCRPYFNHAVA